MGGLYALAYIAGVTYQTMNIYCYFIFYPATFALFLKSKYKYWVLPATLLFFIIPNIEQKSNAFFNKCVAFLNYTGELFHSNYIDMSVYLCVILPLVLYVPFIIKKFESKTLKIIALVIFLISFFYMILIYPFFKSGLIYLNSFIK
jgi:hypothetical protein